jgi:hypothetical protein
MHLEFAGIGGPGSGLLDVPMVLIAPVRPSC